MKNIKQLSKAITISFVICNTNLTNAAHLTELNATQTLPSIPIREVLSKKVISDSHTSIQNLNMAKVGIEAEKNKRTSEQIKNDALNSLFPVRSEYLKLKILSKNKTIEHTQTGTPPVAVIGSDSFSQDWLIKNKTVIKKLGAVIMLVQAESSDDYRKLLALGNGIEVYPISGDLLYLHYGLDFYPCLMTSEKFYQ